MKTLSSIIIILCTVATSFGATRVSVKETSKANVYNIQYQSTKKGKVVVTILDSDNTTLFTEVICDLYSFVRPYNFSSLPEGEYTIAIKDENGVQTQKINNSFDKLYSYTYIAALPDTQNKYWLNIFNNGTEKVAVRILSEQGTTLFEESVTVTGSYQMVYNLDKIKGKSPVTFVVVDGNEEVHSATF